MDAEKCFSLVHDIKLCGIFYRSHFSRSFPTNTWGKNSQDVE